MSGDPTQSESIVVPAVYAPHAAACLRSLGSRGINTIAVYERPTPAFCSRYCDETVLVPSPEDAFVAYKDALLDLARRPDVRTIIPMREADVYALSTHRSEFAEHVPPLWPTFETLTLAHDRLQLVEVAESAGVSVPATQRFSETERWDRRQIIKGCYAFLGDEYADVEPEDAFIEPPSVRFLEPRIEPDSEEVRTEMGHDPIVQEYIPGPEYAL